MTNRFRKILCPRTTDCRFAACVHQGATDHSPLIHPGIDPHESTTVIACDLYVDSHRRCGQRTFSHGPRGREDVSGSRRKETLMPERAIRGARRQPSRISNHCIANLGNRNPATGLSNTKRRGRRFASISRCARPTPTGRRTIIYVQPLGEFTSQQRQIVELSAEYLGIYMNRPVRILKDLPLTVIPGNARRTHPQWKVQQIPDDLCAERRSQAPATAGCGRVHRVHRGGFVAGTGLEFCVRTGLVAESCGRVVHQSQWRSITRHNRVSTLFATDAQDGHS